MSYEIGSEEHKAHVSLIALDAMAEEARARSSGDWTRALIYGFISGLATWVVAELAANA